MNSEEFADNQKRIYAQLVVTFGEFRQHFREQLAKVDGLDYLDRPECWSSSVVSDDRRDMWTKIGDRLRTIPPKIDGWKRALQEKDQELRDCREGLESAKKKLRTLKNKSEPNEDSNPKIAELKRKLNSKDKSLAEVMDAMKAMERRITAKDDTIKELTDKVKQLPTKPDEFYSKFKARVEANILLVERIVRIIENDKGLGSSTISQIRRTVGLFNDDNKPKPVSDVGGEDTVDIVYSSVGYGDKPESKKTEPKPKNRFQTENKSFKHKKYH